MNVALSRPVVTAPSAPEAFDEVSRRRPVLVVAPLYRKPELATRLVASLVACAAELAALQAEVVLFNDSPDDAGLARALSALPTAPGLKLRVEANAENLGFVRTCNRGLEEARRRGFDALLLNSDTVVTPGALTEMARVSRLDPMTAFVNPRSNNATLATLPYQDRFRHAPPEEARAAWAEMARRLPEVSYTPTANGFCLYIRWTVLEEFGLFDELYGRGYNEENDLVMRAGRRGYRAVLANRAFVWHEGSQSFGPEAAALDEANRTRLLERYPEYPGLTQAYFRSPEQRAELILGALVPDAQGRVDVALDFSSFVAAHNGTFAAGVKLLEHAAQLWRDRFNLYVLCEPDTYAFHGMERFGVERRAPWGPEVYAAVYRVGQPYDWGAMQRLALKGAAVGLAMLDTISMDSSQLSSPGLVQLWTYACAHVDLVTAISRQTHDQLGRRFPFAPQVLRRHALLSLDLEDYAPSDETPPEALELPDDYVFVVGNHYWHKDVVAAVNALSEAFPERAFVVLGGARPDETSKAARKPKPPADKGRYAPPRLAERPNIVRVASGKLSDAAIGAIYRRASAVVVPSHYEGFGMPVLNALAARRPVYARALPVVREIWDALGGDANLHVFATTPELVAALREPARWDADGASPGRPGDGARVAREVGAWIDEALERVDYGRIVRRIDALRGDVAPRRPAPATAREFAARQAGAYVERLAALVLRAPALLPGLRAAARSARRLTGWSPRPVE